MKYTLHIYTILVLASLWLGMAHVAKAQSITISGRITESKRNETVPFVHIISSANGKKTASVSNIEGNYTLHLLAEASGADSAWATCIGFEKYRSTIAELSNNPNIELKAASVSLNELVIKAKEDPAYELVRRATRNKSLNDPENLDHFTFKSYNKAAIDVKRSDTIQAELAKSGFAKAHFFLMESATEVMYKKPGKWKESVVANQITGFKNPAFGLLSNSFQPFSVYPSQLNVLDFDFVNPLSAGSDGQYVFELTDSTYVQGELAYIITFQPRKKALGNLMKGSLTIGSERYAIINFRGSNAGEFSLVEFEIRQDYTKMSKSWFPTGSRTYYLMKDESMPLIITSTTYNKEVNLEYEPTASDLGIIQVTYTEESNKLSDEQWDELRPFELDSFETNSYRVWDTLPAKFVNTLGWFMSQSGSLARGRLSLGKTDLLLNHVLRFNQFEGLRLGAGLATNDKLIKWMSLEGYFAYGFRDKQSKYGGGIVFPINPKREFEFAMRYSNDVDEPGRGFIDPDQSFMKIGESIRNLYTRRMNQVQQYKTSISYRPLRGLLLKAFAMREGRTFEYRDYITNATLNPTTAVNTEVGISVRWVPNESLMQLGQSLIPIEIRYPRVDFTVRHALDNWLDGTQNYTRADIALRQQFKSWRLGQTQAYGGAGKIWGENVLHPWLQFSPGVLGARTDFGIQAMGYFQTMGLYEFLNDQYAYAGLVHSFGPIFKIEKEFTKPELKVSYAAGIGSIGESNRAQVPFEYRQMNKPYLEGGIILDNLLRYSSNMYYNGFGIGAYYRHGNYALPDFEDNFFFILSFAIGI